MILNELNVFAFGNLHDEKINLSDGMNTVLKENGWGKSTLATFIKAIFYGLKDSKYSIADNERKKFCPWNFTAKFGGSITYFYDNKSYTVTRFFGQKSAQDEFKLCDNSTGKVILTNGERFGESVFGVDENGFFSTIYHCQKDFEIIGGGLLADKNNEFNNDYDVDKAIRIVENRAKYYKAERGDKGVLTDLKNQLFATEEKIDYLEKISGLLVNLQTQKVELEAQEKSVNCAINSLSDKLAECGKVEVAQFKRNQFNELISEKQTLFDEVKTIDFMFNGYEPQKQEVNAYVECAKDLIAVQSKLSRDKVETVSIDNNKKNNIILFILASLSLIVGITGVFINVIMAIGGFSCCVIFFIVGLTLFYRGKKLLSMSNKTESLKQYIEICDNYVKNIEMFLQKFRFNKKGDYISDLLTINTLIDKRNLILNRLSIINEKLLPLKREIDGFIGSYTESAELIKNQIEQKQSELKIVNSKLQSVMGQMARLEDNEYDLPELYNKKYEILQKIEQAKQEYQTLKLTADYLIKAHENMKVKYRRPLEEKLNYYLEIIGGKNFASAKIDVDLNVTLNQSGIDRQTAYFSKGITDIINICKRFALSDVIFEKDVPFVILDDPFYNLDDQRLTEALKTVKKLAENRQIIYFTCHESRVI